MSEVPTEIQAQVAEMSAAFERRLAAGQKLSELIAGLGKVEVDFTTYFAHINQLSLEEARAERHRKLGYYQEMLNGISPATVGEPVLVTSLTMLHEMGLVGSFSEEPKPVRYVVGVDNEGNRLGKIELAFKQLHIPQTDDAKPAFSERVQSLPIADETAHYRYNENISTDRLFRTKLYIGQQGVQKWVETKFPGIGDDAVEPLFKALDAQVLA
jgi:hypothetical protein